MSDRRLVNNLPYRPPAQLIGAKLYGKQEQEKSFKAHLHGIHFGHGTPKFWHAGQYFCLGPLYLHGKLCSMFFNVDFWDGTHETRTALLDL